jgi:hypothetical protein
MIDYETDPSLHATQPAPERLDDGFSPLHDDAPTPEERERLAEQAQAAIDPALWAKSPF